MKRTFHAFLATALTFALASPSCSWFEKHPVIPAVVTCSGETIPLSLVQTIYADVMGDNWVDLATNVVPLLKDGYADLECVLARLGQSNPETVPHIQKLKAEHADAFRASVSLRSPGDGVPPTGPGAQQFQRAAKSTDEIRSHGEIRQSVSMSEGRPALLVSLNYAGVPPKGPSASLDSTKTRGARPALPGAGGNAEVTTSADAREPSWTHDGPAMSSTTLPPAASGASTGRIAGGSTVHGNLGVATRTGESFAYAGLDIGRLAAACDIMCGAGQGLAVPGGCTCWRGAGFNGHWTAASTARITEAVAR